MFRAGGVFERGAQGRADRHQVLYAQAVPGRREDAGDKTVEVKVVHLPDLENPRYAKLRSGIGFAKYTFTVNESGTLQTVNQETDMKLPETLSNLATLVKSFERKEAPGPQQTFEMYEVVVKNGKTTLTKVDVPK
jgi:hypothetical protein